MRKYIFRCRLSLGDIVLLTGAVRDLQLHFPGSYQLDVRTCFPDLWKHNPYIHPLDEYGHDVKVVDCTLPLIDRSQTAGCHCIHGFVDFFNRYLGTHMLPAAFGGDIHLSPREAAGGSQVHDLARTDLPFWLISAGGKYDCTIKWWSARRYQEVVDHFRGRIQFVQVGDAAHYHPKLRGVIDLRGVTSVRDLLRLMYHAQGVLCGVTGLMHLAAAVPVRQDRYPLRPCVVVAGGRESPHWEAYPGHQFIHTVGALPCCAFGGCWKARTTPLGDGDERDRQEQLCAHVRDGLPRCMDMISSAEVIRRIETYFEGGAARYLSRREMRAAAQAVASTRNHTPSPRPLNFHTASELATQFIENIPRYPGGFSARGIVICGGGVRMFTNAWVCIRMLRRLGCTLPVELWHWGVSEFDARMGALVAPLGVESADLRRVQRKHPAQLTHAWALKPYALLHSRFRQVLLLDADNVPVINPEFLFDTPQFRRAGAVFWPDYNHLKRERPAWKLFGVPYRDEPEFETGQILIDKQVCWRPLNLCLWYNERSDFYYKYVYGDKETFHMAFRRLNARYAMPRHPIHRLRGVMCQHDFLGRRLFQHRNRAKWDLFGPNQRVRGCWFENECRQFLKELADMWDGQVEKFRLPLPPASTGAGDNHSHNGRVSIFACMLSGPERQEICRDTLAKVAATDWATRPVQVQLDEKHFSQMEDDRAYTAWRALQAGLQTDADYILCLADELELNRHWFANLSAWPLLVQRHIHVASLINAGFADLTRIPASHAIAIDPRALFIADAVLISRPAARFLLQHWSEVSAPLNTKIGALSARLDKPVLCHCPSLVRPAAQRRWPNGNPQRVHDFQREWRTPEVNPASLVVLPAAAGKGGHE